VVCRPAARRHDLDEAPRLGQPPGQLGGMRAPEGFDHLLIDE
jgi:hypothetical protein